MAAPLGHSQAGDPLVRVRVEGKTTTIFGATEPRAWAATPLAALEAASLSGEFHYRVQELGFGPYVDQIGRYRAEGSSGWAFKVNGASPPVGADKVELKDGDVVLWYWATFGDTGGPPTLLLRRPTRNCYAVFAQDDGGRTTPVAAVLRYDGKELRTKGGGRYCILRPHGQVRATASGMVRSNALP
jgi:hypothetical protein